MAYGPSLPDFIIYNSAVVANLCKILGPSQISRGPAKFLGAICDWATANPKLRLHPILAKLLDKLKSLHQISVKIFLAHLSHYALVCYTCKHSVEHDLVNNHMLPFIHKWRHQSVDVSHHYLQAPSDIMICHSEVWHQENVMTSYVLYMTLSGQCHDIICVIIWHYQENVMRSYVLYMTLSGECHDIICVIYDIIRTMTQHHMSYIWHYQENVMTSCVIYDIIRTMSWHHMCYIWHYQDNVTTSYVLYMTSSGQCHDIICVIDDIIRTMSWHHMCYRWHYQENIMTSYVL